MAQNPANTLQVSVVTDPEGFAALRPEWGDLLERARIASVFMSWEWLFPWWRFYGAGQELRILVARRGVAIVGILPVYIRKARVMRVISTSTLRFLGTGGDTSPDDLDALLDPEHCREAALALANFAAGSLQGWDVLNLTDMGEESPFRRALVEVLPRHGLARCTQGISARISYLDLPKDWDTYLEAQSAHKRGALRRNRRHFESQPGARFFLWTDASRLDAAIDRLIELHHLRWQGRAEGFAFSSPVYNAFHREVMRGCCESGRLRLYCLELGGSLVAIYYCYLFRGRIFYFQSGFDPALAKLRLGQVLMDYAIEHAIGERNTVFDMLRGEYEYKSRWATERRETHYCQAFRPGIRSLAQWFRHEWLPAVKQRFRPDSAGH